MLLKLLTPLLLISTFVSSCKLNNEEVAVASDSIKRYCGYDMSKDEFNEIAEQTSGNQNPYLAKNSSETFLEIYNTLKSEIDSTVVYELTLAKLKIDEVWLDLKTPRNGNSVNEIMCLIMDSNFSELVPKQIKVRIFEKDFASPLGRDQNILIGIKRLK